MLCTMSDGSLRKHTYIILTPLNLFYTVKQGFTGVYIIFLISAQKRRMWALIKTDEAILKMTPEKWSFFCIYFCLAKNVWIIQIKWPKMVIFYI